jgi:hypothetical protein
MDVDVLNSKKALATDPSGKVVVELGREGENEGSNKQN